MFKDMSYNIQDNVCESCGLKARVAVNDDNQELHYYCLYHFKDSFDKYLDNDA